jgi:hypothetical protein
MTNIRPFLIPITIFALGTAAIHLYLNVMLSGLDPAMTANAVGYLGLLGLYASGVLADKKRWLLLAFITYTVLTIVLWAVLGDKSFSTPLGQIGWLDKAIEVGLLAALVLALRRIGGVSSP